MSLVTEKQVPSPSNVAPKGKGCPGQTFTSAERSTLCATRGARSFSHGSAQTRGASAFYKCRIRSTPVTGRTFRAGRRRAGTVPAHPTQHDACRGDSWHRDHRRRRSGRRGTLLRQGLPAAARTGGAIRLHAGSAGAPARSRARAARALGHSDCGRAALGPRADRLVPLERGHEPRREPPGFSREPGREAARSARAAALAGRRAGLDRPAQQGDRPRGRARSGAQGRDRGVADGDGRARSLRDAAARRARNGGHRGRARDLHPRAERSSQADLRAVRAARLAHLAARARGGGSARQRLPGAPGHRLRDCRA